MTRSNLAVATLVALAACSGGPKPPRGTPVPPAAAATPAEIDAAFDLLMAGKEDDARKALDRLLKRDPMSANARLLRDSIGRDPKELMGPVSFPYTVRAGDTLVGVSQRLLGNRLKAYQLLRYNDLRAPVLLTPGQVLRIPGEPPRIEVPRTEPVRRPDTTPTPAPRPRPAPVKPTPAPAAPSAANPAAARSARAAGLAALNGGAVNRAVGLLRRAAQLDPGNPLIARDLARAERIAATVRARK
jgi:LysM repeat protein